MTDLCFRCGGSKMYMGNGMIMTPCTLCSDKKEFVVTLDKVDRRSKSYKKTIDDLMELHPKMTRDEAVKLFDKTYENV